MYNVPLKKVKWFCNVTLIEKSDWFFEKVWNWAILIWLVKVKCRLQGCHRIYCMNMSSIFGGVEGGGSLFRTETWTASVFLYRYLLAEQWKYRTRCFVSLKVQMLAVVKAALSVWQSHSKVWAWHMLSCNTAVFAILTVTNTKV